MIEPADVQDLIARWWWHYDAAEFEELTRLLTLDTTFVCRTDTGQTAFEEFVRADVAGRDAVMTWQREHRLASPYPLRHNGTNIHLTRRGESDADFASYLFVTQVVGLMPSPLPGGRVTGSVRLQDRELRIASLDVVLDTEESVVLSERAGSPSVEA